MPFFLLFSLSGWSPLISAQEISAHPLRCIPGVTSFMNLSDSPNQVSFHPLQSLGMIVFLGAHHIPLCIVVICVHVFSQPQGQRPNLIHSCPLVKLWILHIMVFIIDFIYLENPGCVPQKWITLKFIFFQLTFIWCLVSLLTFCYRIR